MKRILSCSLAASAIFAMAISSVDAAARTHHPTGHYGAAAAKLRTQASRQLLAGEPLQTSVGRFGGDNSNDRNAYEIQKWGLLGP
jgi:hypothetical protein